MKAKLATLIACSALLISSHAIAGCGSNDWGDQYGYQRTQSNACECTDRGWAWNDCISKEKFCDAFGNIGV